MSSQGSVSRQSKEEQDLYEMKKAAAEFYRVNRVPQEIERALSQLLLQQPEDLHGYLADYFKNLSAPPRISRLKGREVYDASGQLSIEAKVFCIICNNEKVKSISHIPPFCLYSFFMARYLEEKTRNRENSCSPSQPEVVAPSPTPMQTKDKKSAEKDKKSRNITEKPFVPAEPSEPVLHGSLAIGSLSLAVVKTGAQIQGIPLYKYIAVLTGREAPTQFHIPVSLVTLLSCGKTSPGKLNLLKEVILIPKMGQRVKQIITMTLELQKEMMRIMNSSTKALQAIACDSGALTVSYERPEQPLDLITEACRNLELTLGTDIHLAVNCAAPELMDYTRGKYEVATGVLKSPDELVDMYQTLICKYPAMVALIDPFRREDTDQWEKLSKVTGHSCLLISDITYKSQAPPLPGVRGLILKHVNETTVSDLICISSKHKVVFQCAAALLLLLPQAVGLGLDYVILGGLSGAQRMLKYNRLISIEEELAQQGILGRFFFFFLNTTPLSLF
uniref:Enolase 4 n=1 Tax=Amphiprion percula TaxID=161767 RepID=A0A3P8RYF0_AMPPE